MKFGADVHGFAVYASPDGSVGKNGIPVASVNCATPNLYVLSEYSCTELEANARLIAAAPALYEALKEIVSRMPTPLPPPVGPEDGWFVRPEAINPLTMGAIRRARAALALVASETGTVNAE